MLGTSYLLVRGLFEVADLVAPRDVGLVALRFLSEGTLIVAASSTTDGDDA